MQISIVIPTKNEEVTIAEIISGCRPYGDEILVVDGHSSDKTREIAEDLEARVVLDNGRGKGDGIRVGLQSARGDIVVFIDADGSHDVQDIPDLVKPIIEAKADLVIGSRMIGGSDELHGDIGKFVRIMGSMIITLAINYRFAVRLTDSQNGFRAIRREVGLKLGLKEDIFTIEQEMLIKVLKNGFTVKEVPSHEYARKCGVSGIVVWKMAHQYVWSLIKNLF